MSTLSDARARAEAEAKEAETAKPVQTASTSNETTEE